MIGSQFKTETVNGITVKYPREWERGTYRQVLHQDGTPIGAIMRSLVGGGSCYSYNGHKTFPKALEAIVRGAAKAPAVGYDIEAGHESDFSLSEGQS